MFLTKKFLPVGLFMSTGASARRSFFVALKPLYHRCYFFVKVATVAQPFPWSRVPLLVGSIFGMLSPRSNDRTYCSILWTH